MNFSHSQDAGAPINQTLCIVRRTFFSTVMCLLVFSQTTSTFAQSYPPISNITYAEAFASLKKNRDRLMRDYAQTHGYGDAVQAWQNMDASQKGVFLTITDNLGRRSFAHLNKNFDYRYVGDSWDSAAGCPAMNTQNLNQPFYYIRPPSWGPGCVPASPEDCVYLNKCTKSQGTRTDFDMALNHVVRFYAINGGDGSCRGAGNRVYFQADDELIYMLRNLYTGLPEWENSMDPAGPHSPFTQSRQGGRDFPIGQSHQFAWDHEAVALNRPGVVGVYDPHIVEMDIDYNWVHDSNPECSYGNMYGRLFYEHRSLNRGLGGNAELNYQPSNDRES